MGQKKKTKFETGWYVCCNFFKPDNPCCKTICYDCQSFWECNGIHVFDAPTEEEKKTKGEDRELKGAATETKKKSRKRNKKVTPRGQSASSRLRKKSLANLEPEYGCDENGCQHANPNFFQRTTESSYLAPKEREKRELRGKKNISTLCMDCRGPVN